MYTWTDQSEKCLVGSTLQSARKTYFKKSYGRQDDSEDKITSDTCLMI